MNNISGNRSDNYFDGANNHNATSGTDNAGKNILRPYYNPETFNANYEARYIPKEGIIDSHGLPLVSKLKSVGSLIQQQQPSFYNSSQNWWLKFKQENAIDGTSSHNIHINSASGINLRGIGSDYYGQTIFSSFRDYFKLHKWSEFIKMFIFKFGKVYMKHLLIQPFVVSKTFLQVHDFSNNIDNKEGIELHVKRPENFYITDNNNEDKDVVYFKQKGDFETIGTTESSEQIEINFDNIKQDSAEVFVEGGTSYHKIYKIKPSDSSISKVIQSVYEIEGTFGVVRSNNTTFIYNFLSGTLEAWLNGFISPFLNIPDPNFVEVSLSNNLTSSILLVLSSTLITGVILLPFELINMKFMITKMRHIHFNRSIREHIKKFKVKNFFVNLFTKPKNLKLLIFQALNRLNTAIYHKLLVQTVVLHGIFEIDKFTNYTKYETGNFLIKFFQLIVKVPLDNLYKREQVSFLLNEDRLNKDNSLLIENKKDLIIVPYKDISLIEYFTNMQHFKGLWKGYKLELIGCGCGYILSLLDTEREVTTEERF
ncbi:hypothetical protein QEN19_001188 [Hanseniaspora menglaensis]